MTRITGLGWPLLALAACLLALSVVGAIWITHFDDANAGVIPLLQAVPYVIAAWLVVSGRIDGANSTRVIATILVVGLVWPVSTDIYRYVWDGACKAPASIPTSACRRTRSGRAARAAIYPDINRADYAPTIYPPVRRSSSCS